MKDLFLTFIFVALTTTIFAQDQTSSIVYFSPNNYELADDAKIRLSRFLEKIKNKKIKSLKIIGHTDSDGNEEFNKSLSQKRAKNVSDYLIENGINANIISSDHFGEKKLKFSDPYEVWKQQNRRVEIIAEFASFSVPEPFTVGYKQFNVNPNSDTLLVLDSKGTVLHISKFSFVDDADRLIKEKVIIKYREFSNSAEIAFSDIPMTYKTNGQEFFFNSSGMFEITGEVNGKSVTIAREKSLKIDYALVRKNPNTSFFKLESQTNNWVKLHDLRPLIKAEVKKDKIAEFLLEGDGMQGERDGGDFVFKDDGNRKDATLLAEGADAGHTYPDIVKGLNVDGFGVYNCDQIYRVANRVNLNAKFVDKEGKEILGQHVVSLIDLKYNGAFSFDPKQSITCDGKGKNVLALFTKNGQFYLLEKGDFEGMKIEKSGAYTFRMKDMTNIIKNSKDLARLLGIKI